MIVDGLIDSGADHNLFSIAVAKICGIDLAHTTKVKTNKYNQRKAKETGLLVPVKYTLGNYEWVGATVFLDTEEPHGLLGQEGFFDAFDVLFSYKNKTMDLRPTNAEIIDSL